MTRFSKSALLLGAALAVLSACSGTKGPGKIGTKDDIVVRNNGMPGANQTAAAPDADFSSTVEQGEAIPAPAVAAAEPLPDASPVVEAAAQQVADAKAPLPSTTATPTADAGGSAMTSSVGAKPIDQIVPQTPVQEATVVPPATTPSAAPAPATTQPAPETASSVYPTADYAPAAVPPTSAPAAAAPAVPVAAPSANAYVPVPPGTDYPLDPNAPYSPKAMAGAVAATSAAPVTGAALSPAAVPATGLNLSDPAVIRSAQTALKTKAGYAGEVSGTIDAAFLNALTVYQGMNKLPVGGLNEATLRHLGVIE